MKVYPFLVNEKTSGRRLQPIEGKGQGYDEAWLQELIRKHPDTLPVAEIEPVFSPMIAIGREVSTETGVIDNLFISHRGYLILVETKLWKNPEARREVVAQVIDYAVSLSKWNYERLNNVSREYTKKYEDAELDLVDWVEKQLGPVEGGRDFFEEIVAQNLRLGRSLALIVGDRIRQSIVEMVDHVNKYPGLALNIALVELQGYRVEKGHRWPLLIVPSIVSHTEIVERSVVQVTVMEGKTPEVSVRQEKVKAEDIGRKRVSLTEEAFWELLRKRVPSHYEVMKNLIDELKGKTGIEVVPRENSIVIRLNLHGTGQMASLFFVTTDAKLCVWPKTLANQLSSAGFDTTLAEDYDHQMREILQMPEHRTDLSRSISEVNVEKFKTSVDQLIREIRDYESKQQEISNS